MLERFKNEKLAIKFDSVEEQIEFLGIAEKEGFKWNSGDDPTKYAPSIYECISYNFDNSSGLGYSTETWFLQKYWQVITWKDYKAEYKKQVYSNIVYSNVSGIMKIDKNGIKITPLIDVLIKAIYPNEKKRIVVVKWGDDTTTKVKCSKEDNFDIYIGVALAIAIKKYGTNSQFRKNVDKLVVKNNG